jgi:hypothetical protein
MAAGFSCMNSLIVIHGDTLRDESVSSECGEFRRVVSRIVSDDHTIRSKSVYI